MLSKQILLATSILTFGVNADVRADHRHRCDLVRDAARVLHEDIHQLRAEVDYHFGSRPDYRRLLSGVHQLDERMVRVEKLVSAHASAKRIRKRIAPLDDMFVRLKYDLHHAEDAAFFHNISYGNQHDCHLDSLIRQIQYRIVDLEGTVRNLPRDGHGRFRQRVPERQFRQGHGHGQRHDRHRGGTVFRFGKFAFRF